jgi:DNA polymerase-3 subunit delta'
MNAEAPSEEIPPSSQPRMVDFLHRYASEPPKVLLLEGGSIEERQGLALYWAALLSCSHGPPPCSSCEICRQIRSRAFRELLFFSGREGPIKIEEIREVRRMLGQKPDSGPVRVIVFSEAQELTQASANALLKSLEEPLPNNHFVLLAPQRNWLLPTLVSRSFVLTLSWSRPSEPEATVSQTWRPRLIAFWRSGQGLFEHTAKKSEVDKLLVQDILGDCRQALRQFLSGEQRHPMAALWAERLSAEQGLAIDRILGKAFEALRYQTTPSLVLDWVALQIWQRLRRSAGS